MDPRSRGPDWMKINPAAGSLFHEKEQTSASDFDPAVRDRLVAGTMLPASWVVRAPKFRWRYRDTVLALFDEVDAIIEPATPCRAPRGGQQTFTLDGIERCAMHSLLGLQKFPAS